MEEEIRTLQLNLAYGKDLKKASHFSKMEVYAAVSIAGDPKHAEKPVKTPADKEGGNNPVWNFPIKLTFNQSLARQNRLTLQIHLRCDRQSVGHLHVPLANLLNNSGQGKSPQHVTYQVIRPSGRPQGALNFSYKFSDLTNANAHQNDQQLPKSTDPAAAAAENKAELVASYPPPATGPGGFAPYGPKSTDLAAAAENKAEPVVSYPSPATGPGGFASFGLTPYQAAHPTLTNGDSIAAAYQASPTQQHYAAGYGYRPPQQGAEYSSYPPYGGYPAGYGGYPPQGAGYSGYPAQGAGYGGYPPQGYGYPAQPNYNYPPGYPNGNGKGKKGKKGKGGKLGLGLGLGAGLLGGAAVGATAASGVGDAITNTAGEAITNVATDFTSGLVDSAITDIGTNLTADGLVNNVSSLLGDFGGFSIEW